MKAKAALLVALLCLAFTAQGMTITDITLTDLGAGVTPNAINNAGQVVGQDSSGQAFLWQNGTTTPLGTLGGAQSAANDINDSGIVVGWAHKSNGKKAPFKWAGSMVNLDPTSTIDNVAEAINARGDVVGWRQATTTWRSVIWGYDGGRSTLFGSNNTKALGISDNGEVVGITLDALGQVRGGCYWDGSGDGSNWTTGFDSYYPLAGINNNSLSGGEMASFASYWNVGEGVNGIAKLNPADLSSLVCGLNDQSLLVGYSGDKAFLFDLSHQSLIDLSIHLPAGSPFSQLTVANDINDSEMFVGVGLVSGVQHGFVGQITTVPEPSTACALASLIVTGGLVWLIRRRWALRTLLALLAILPCLVSFANAETLGDHLWNVRENTEGFFHNNVPYVRPWHFAVDDGWGEFVGPPPYGLDFHWDTASTIGNPVDGTLSLDRGMDTQFHAWTYLYASAPTPISLAGDGDCVPRWFLNYAFDSPQEFPLGSPATINLVAGWNRLDITGYNQNTDFLFETSALTSQVYAMNTSIITVPEPSTLVLLGIGTVALLVWGRWRQALKIGLFRLLSGPAAKGPQTNAKCEG